MANLIDNIISCSWQKDLYGRFISCCENTAMNAGLDSPKQMQGKTDHDLIWSNRAKLYWQEELAAISGKHISNLQLQKNIYGDTPIVVTKFPIYNKFSEIIGTGGSCIILAITHHHSPQNNAPKHLKLNATFNNAILTKRESQTFMLLSKGYTNKMIANELALSIRTIETHIENIKIKTGFNSKIELVRAAIESETYLSLLFFSNQQPTETPQ